MAVKFNLKCDDYQSKWSKSLSNLRSETAFADVTLVSVDKVKFPSHKILLSSYSETFKFMLKEENANTNPLIYLSGVGSVDLGLILDFIYHGEINLYQEQLESFLGVAGELEVVGLQGYSKGKGCHEKNIKTSNIQSKVQDEDEEDQLEEEIATVKIENPLKILESEKDPQSTPWITPNYVERIDVSSMNPEEIGDKILGLCQKADGVWKCLACNDYSNAKRAKVRRHIESHIDGLSYTCALCIKDFKTKNALENHNSLRHRFTLDVCLDRVHRV